MTVVVGAAIVRAGTLLAAQRAYPHDLAGLWELPGGRVEPDESDEAALIRECREELAVEVTIGARIGPDVPLSPTKVLRIYVATLVDGSAEPVALEHRSLRWLAPRELATLEWLPADRILVPDLDALLRKATRPHRLGSEQM